MEDLSSYFFHMLYLAKTVHDNPRLKKEWPSFDSIPLDEDAFYELSMELAVSIFEDTSSCYNEESDMETWVHGLKQKKGWRRGSTPTAGTVSGSSTRASAWTATAMTTIGGCPLVIVGIGVSCFSRTRSFMGWRNCPWHSWRSWMDFGS